MPVTRAHLPTRLRVDAAALVQREGEIASGLDAALGRALDSASRALAEAGVAGGPVQAHPPEVLWSGAGLAQLPVEVRKQFERRLAGIVAQRAGASQLGGPQVAAGTLATDPHTPASVIAWAQQGGQTGVSVVGGGGAPRVGDRRLEDALVLIRAVRARHPEPSANSAQVLAELDVATDRIDPEEPDRLAAIAREVQRLFPAAILVSFLAKKEERASWRRRELHSVTGTPGPGLLLPHILLLPGGVSVDVVRLENAIATIDGFLGGVFDGFREKIGQNELARLAKRANWSVSFSTVFPPVFVAGAVTGIVKDAWESITGVVDLVRNLPEILDAIDQMLDIIFSPQGKDVGRVLGLEVGREYAKDVEELLAQNFITFTFNLGKKIGPAIFYAVAALMGLGPALMASLATRLAPILRPFVARFPRLAALMARAGKLVLGPLPELPDVKPPGIGPPHAGSGHSAGLVKGIEEELATHRPGEALPMHTPEPDPELSKILGHGEPEYAPAPAGAPGGWTHPQIKGGKDPTIEGRRVPHREAGQLRPDRLDIEDIRRLPGETARDAVRRVERVINKRIEDLPDVKNAWNKASKHLLGNRPVGAVTREEMLGHPPWKTSLYDRVRDRFWQHEVPSSKAAQKAFIDAGFDVSQPKAPMLITDGARPLPDWERRVSLDHSAEKALANNWRKAIDADNLTFEFQGPNSWREIVQVRHHMRDPLDPGWIEVPIGTRFPRPLE